MKLYIRSSHGYEQTDGMDQDTVTKLLTDLGATDIQFMTEEEWTAANPPRVRP